MKGKVEITVEDYDNLKSKSLMLDELNAHFDSGKPFVINSKEYNCTASGMTFCVGSGDKIMYLADNELKKKFDDINKTTDSNIKALYREIWELEKQKFLFKTKHLLKKKKKWYQFIKII